MKGWPAKNTSILLALVCLITTAPSATEQLQTYLTTDSPLDTLPGFALARQEVEAALAEAGFPASLVVVSLPAKISPQAGDVWIELGRPLRVSDEPSAFASFAGEGFRLCSRREDSGVLRVGVEASTQRSFLYGLTYLARLIRLQGAVPEQLDVERRPAFVLRMASDSPAMALRMGFNLVPVEPHPAEVVFLERVEPPLFAAEAREELLQRRRLLSKAIQEARDYGLEAIAWGDEFQLPTEVLRPDLLPLLTPKDYDPEQADLGMGLGRIFCFAKPTVWDLVAMKYRELFEEFPDLAGTMVRLGENYSSHVGSHVVGNGVYAYGRPMYCEHCRDTGYEDRIAGTIQRLFRTIVEEQDQLYIHRTWDISDTFFHSNADLFRRIAGRLPKDERLILSTKYTTSDFWRYNPMNDTFSLPGGPRMVEVQCTREYEGKGAYPNFIGEEVQPILAELAGRGVVGIWSWHHGGGQGGPRVKCDVWNQANIYLVGELAWNPRRSAEEIALEWATLLVGPEAAAPMAKLLLLSDDAVVALRYFEAYSSRHPGWTPANLWLRDDKIRGSRHLAKIYFDARDEMEAMLREKDRAVRTVQQQRRRLDEVRRKCKKDEIRVFCSDDFTSRRPVGPVRVTSGGLEEAWVSREEFFSALQTSLDYELALARLLREYCAAYFYGHRWLEAGRSGDRLRAGRSLRRWKEAWRHYTEDIPSLPFAPSLYQDDGMVAATEYIERSLQEGREPLFAWWTLGPFSNKDKRGFACEYPPEKEIDFSKSYPGEEGKVVWKRLPASLIYDGYHDLDAWYEVNDWVVAYAWTSFDSKREQSAQLHLGSDDGIIAWVNGRRVVEEDAYRAAQPDQHVVPLRLKGGKNEILLKVTEGILGWGFYFRLTDSQGKPLEGIQPTGDERE